MSSMDFPSPTSSTRNIASVLFAGGVDGTTSPSRSRRIGTRLCAKPSRFLTRIEKNPYLKLCLTAEELRAAKQAGKVGVMFGTQGASMLEEKLWRLEILVRMGLRILGLAYTTANAFGDGCGEKRDAGFGLSRRRADRAWSTRCLSSSIFPIAAIAPVPKPRRWPARRSVPIRMPPHYGRTAATPSTQR